MIPKFRNTRAWEEAKLLMQPAFIRVVDNIRKQLEVSDWKGSYEEVETPIPGYNLCLTRQDESVKVDMWDLCFQICFHNYTPMTDSEEDTHAQQEVEVDSTLIDETGDVDWQNLEDKTKGLIEQVFASLPS